MKFTAAILLFVLQASTVQARSPLFPLVIGIFGFGNKEQKQKEQLQLQQRQAAPQGYPKRRQPPQENSQPDRASNNFSSQQQQQQQEERPDRSRPPPQRQQQQQYHGDRPLPPPRQLQKQQRPPSGGVNRQTPPPFRPPPPPPPPSDEARNANSHLGDAANDEQSLDDDKADDIVESNLPTTDAVGENATLIAESDSPQTSKGVPPPPPPESSMQQSNTDANDNDNEEHKDSQQGDASHEDSNWMAQQLPGPQNQGGWGPPPPAFQQNFQAAPDQVMQAYYQDDYYMQPEMILHAQLDDAIARENDLIYQIENLTTSIHMMEQREELHMRQLDVLTERVMDVESQSAADRNALVELETNCTYMDATILDLNKDVEEWKQKCGNVTDRCGQAETKVSELKQDLRAKCREAEELAIAIENLRLAEKEKAAYMSRRHKNKAGFFSWLFGYSATGDASDYEDFSREEAYDMAKSSLLRALQTERNNVDELESAVISLQQNNSAISEMVNSRDSIIEELNGRVAVFEEDKVVLKAALRQLQNEMKDEAPKTQKLIDELAWAREELDRSKEETNSIILTHRQELASLQKGIESKQQAISEKDSNLTTIGTYVDRLEERLTSFAITRRDLEQRENRCKIIEESMKTTESEMKVMETKIQEYEKEEKELKKLLEELAQERAVLQKERRKLITEGEFQRAEEEQLKSKLAKMELDILNEKEVQSDLEQKLRTQEHHAMTLQVSNEELEVKLRKMEELETQLASLQADGVQLGEEKKEKEASLAKVLQEKVRLEHTIADLQDMLKTLSFEENERQQKVPFRSLRKEISKRTGLHGIVTPSSKMVQEVSRNHHERVKPISRDPPAARSTPTAKPAPTASTEHDDVADDAEVTEAGASVVPSPPAPEVTANPQESASNQPFVQRQEGSMPPPPPLPASSTTDNS